MTAADRREFERSALTTVDVLRREALRLTRDSDAADDLVQDAMLRAFRYWSTFQQGTNIKAWMFTILRNTFISGYHKAGRTRALQADVTTLSESVGQAVACAASQVPGPADSITRDKTRALVADALAGLRPEYRTAVELADIQGLSYREIAAVMECPIGSVMSRLHRGRAALRAALAVHATEYFDPCGAAS